MVAKSGLTLAVWLAMITPALAESESTGREAKETAAPETQQSDADPELCPLGVGVEARLLPEALESAFGLSESLPHDPQLLVQQGVAPGNLSGAGYGEFQPVAPNDSAEDRRRNRRIEIVMLPNLDVIATTQLPG